MEQERRSTTQKVAGNTFWYGLELTFSVLGALLVSIPVARVIGPTKLGYFNYIQWLTNISGTLAMLGIPATTRKYMAEYLGRGEPATAWRIYRASLGLQVWIALALGGGATLLVLHWVEPSYRWISMLLLLGVMAKMVACIPSSANMGAEDLRANVPGSATNVILAIGLVNLSLQAGWGLTGVAASMAVGMTAELALKLWAVRRWLHPVEGGSLPPELRRRMFTFSGQSVVLMGLNIVVWDRSDLVFLKLLDKDIRQVTFFTLAFNLVDKILMLPQALSAVIGTSVMAEYGRDRMKLYRVASVAAKYALLVSVPAMLGTAAVSSPLMRVLYGSQYLPAIPVLLIGAVLAVAKPLLMPVQSLMQAEERQGFLIWWGLLCGAANVAFDLTFIPLWAARGAMLANGLAQVLAITGTWVKAGRSFPLTIAPGMLVKILGCGALMGAPVWLLGRTALPAAVQLVLGVPAGAALYLLAMRQAGVLDEADRRHFTAASMRLPGPAMKWAQRLFGLLVVDGGGLGTH